MRWRSRLSVLCLQALFLSIGAASSRPALAESGTGPEVSNGGATADSQAPANAATNERARELFLDGVKAAQAAHWRQAYASFLSAWSLKKHYQIAANLGDCELRFHLYRDAAEHFAFSLRELPADASADDRAQTETRLQLARARVATLRIDIDAIGVDILVDGRPVSRTPLLDPVFVDPGEHLIEVKPSTGSGRSQSITVAAGEEAEINLRVGPDGSAPSSVAAPKAAPSLSSPSPIVTGRSSLPIFLGAALSVAAVGTGLGFTLAGASASADRTARIEGLRGTNPCGGGTPYVSACNEIERSSAAERTYRGLGIAGFALGGAVAAATLAWALWPRASRSSAATPRLSFYWQGQSGAGGAWSIAF